MRDDVASVAKRGSSVTGALESANRKAGESLSEQAVNNARQNMQLKVSKTVFLGRDKMLDIPVHY